MPQTQRASLQHPLGRDSSIPKMIPPDRLAYLTGRIRSGEITLTERDELARGFIRLALKIAAGCAARRPDKGDDYASAALFGIVYALDHAKEKLVDDNITPYVISNIRRFIGEFYRNDHVVRVPARTFSHKKAQGEEMVTTSVITMDDREINAGANNRKMTTYHRVKKVVVGGYFAFKELLGMSARDDKDREILRLRAEGHTDVEIAELTGLSKSSINNRRTEMEARFDKLNQE